MRKREREGKRERWMRDRIGRERVVREVGERRREGQREIGSSLRERGGVIERNKREGERVGAEKRGNRRRDLDEGREW